MSQQVKQWANALAWSALALSSASIASDMSDFLDDYEEIVSAYEQYANKSRLCSSDLLKLNSEVIARLIPLSQRAQTLQPQFTSEDLQRYLSVMNRYSAAMSKLSPKMGNVSC